MNSAALTTINPTKPTVSDEISPRTNAYCCAFNVDEIRKDFPILSRQVHGKPLVYLDNAATSHKPKCVIDAITRAYTEYYSNIHRGVHLLSQLSTQEHDLARGTIQKFMNAAHPYEIIFVRNATEAINLVAQSYARPRFKEGDEILITHMEHHANIVPWQMVCEQTGAVLKVAPIDDNGELIMEEFERLLTPKTKLVGVVHLSNALGTINPVKKIIDMAHSQNIPVLVDGAQAIPHMKVDVEELDCDFYVFSGHKVYGPSGIGVLYGKAELLESMPPYQGGGDMIKSVTFEKTLYNDLPYKFEAGTPDIVGPIGLAAALDYISKICIEKIARYEESLFNYANEILDNIPEIQRIGTASHRAGVITFVMKNAHPHDIGTIMDREGIAIRTGHHCAQPVMERFGVPATARASLAFYNTCEEIDILAKGIEKVIEVFH